MHPQLSFALTSHFSYLCSQRLDNGTKFHRTSHFRSSVLMRIQIKQVKPAFNPLVNACIVVNTHEGLTNSIAVLAADIVLLLTMLIGLLRHANKNPSGVWNLLYQQVTSNQLFSLASKAEFFLVYNLDTLGGDRRDTNCGQYRFCRFKNIQFNVLKVFLILDLNGAYFSARACEGSADSYL